MKGLTPSPLSISQGPNDEGVKLEVRLEDRSQETEKGAGGGGVRDTQNKSPQTANRLIRKRGGKRTTHSGCG